MSALYYTRGSLRQAHSLRICTLLNNRPNCSSNSPESEPIVEICVMAVVRHADLVICGEQWATSWVVERTYSHIKFHSGQRMTHDAWISVGLLTRLVKMVTGKPVNRFPTGNGFRNVSPAMEFIACHGDTTQATLTAEFDRYVDAPMWVHIPALPRRDCRHPQFSCAFGAVGRFWTSVLATGRLSTSAAHICCPNTWTVLYFWMEI